VTLNAEQGALAADLATEKPSQDSIMSAQARVPSHVVYRAFVNETVILNLETGMYHGLNPSGGTMLETLDRSATVREAVAELVDQYGQPESQIKQDVCEFCLDLLDRGLIELRHDANR
jgi:hypothetical protein